ncbi:uncharacterized, partial [Tachysurus ichikawai]
LRSTQGLLAGRGWLDVVLTVGDDMKAGRKESYERR